MENIFAEAGVEHTDDIAWILPMLDPDLEFYGQVDDSHINTNRG